MVDEDVIKEKYGKDYTYEKWYSTEIDLTTLPKNKSVVYGDGETYCWMLTKKESRLAENLVSQGRSLPDVACGRKMYGWENFKTGNISMVYDNMKLLLMCSPDHFETRIKNGEGEIVELTIVESKPA
jgi:hypothetical protein